jgi:hypothetical protein
MPDSDERFFLSRYRCVVAAIVRDQGGLERPSEVRLQLIRRFAACCVLAERMEARLACGTEINIDRYRALCDSAQRIARTIGIDRATRGGESTISDLLRAE